MKEKIITFLLAIFLAYSIGSESYASHLDATQLADETQSTTLSIGNEGKKTMNPDSLPFTAEVLQKKLYDLLALHGGLLEPGEVEAAFAVKSFRKAVYGDSGYVLGFEGQSPLGRNLSYERFTKAYAQNGRFLNTGGNLSILIIPWSWGHVSKIGPYCLNPFALEKNLQALGWKTLPKETKFADFATNNYVAMIKNPTYSIISFSYGFQDARADPSAACVFVITVSGRN